MLQQIDRLHPEITKSFIAIVLYSHHGIMLTKLLFPPQWIPTQPYLSVPSLTAFLKANGCLAEQDDINVRFYDDLLSKKSLKNYYKRSVSKFQELEKQNVLSPELQKQYVNLSTSILLGDYVIEEVDAAKEILRNKEDFYDIEKLFKAFKILELGLKLASSAYLPSNLTFHAYDMSYSCRSSRDVLSAINHREQNLFIDYFEKNTIPGILKNSPDLVGISIINTSQLIPGLTLANLIKKADENIHINIGGSIFTRLINEISKNNELFTVFDSVIVHEGETALLNLVRHIEERMDIEKVPNLIYKKGAQIEVNTVSSKGEDINSLPTPSFDGFPLDLYFSPELILPVLSSRGCYWGRCTFCDHSYGYSGNYRPRDVDKLYNEVATLKNKYNTDYFTFQDEGLSPKLISSLSEKIIKNKLDISWLADSRFEPVFTPEFSKRLSEAGCRMLYLGLESANERILKCMDKGVKKENVPGICRSCTDAGIWTHLFLIFGFPTETRQEARETMDFILKNRQIIRSMSFGSFQLTRHSKVYENPEAFNIRMTGESEKNDLSLWYEYKAEKGMSKNETEELISGFYNDLSREYRDLQIWSNLDREHLFLYISHYKKHYGKLPNLGRLVDIAHQRKKGLSVMVPADKGPVLNEGIFAGAFNFNLAQMIHARMKGKTLNVLQKEHTNVLFDTNNNRVFTISDLGKAVLDNCNGRSGLEGIIGLVMEKYGLQYGDAAAKCRSFLKGLSDKNMIIGM
jgi:radical SAM superfamily enzyme YgiQ (UPF0313 family)